MSKVLHTIIVLLSLSLGESGFPQTDSPAGLQGKLAELEKAAAEYPARKIDFNEQRFFSFRKVPVELEGVLRIWEDHGVSIVYPEKRTGIVADETGVLLRKYSKDGGFRQKSGGSGESDTMNLLKAAFEFDRVALEEAFEMDWQNGGEQWSIGLTPRDPEEKKIERLLIIGTGEAVVKIEMSFAGDRRIEIQPQEEIGLERFSEEDERLYFRESQSE